MTIPNIWENKKWQPNHQPDICCTGQSSSTTWQGVDQADRRETPGAPHAAVYWGQQVKSHGSRQCPCFRTFSRYLNKWNYDELWHWVKRIDMNALASPIQCQICPFNPRHLGLEFPHGGFLSHGGTPGSPFVENGFSLNHPATRGYPMKIKPPFLVC